MQGEPQGCASACGVGAGLSGTPGKVTCDGLRCDPAAKPAEKKCPKTADCGKFPDTKRVVHACLTLDYVRMFALVRVEHGI